MFSSCDKSLAGISSASDISEELVEEVIEEITEETTEETTEGLTEENTEEVIQENSEEIDLEPLSKKIILDLSTTHQTVEGFGAGIKRRTEYLYRLSEPLRQKIENYCFRDLEVNMIRFFVYHDLEPENDNDDPNILDPTQLDWIKYESNPSRSRSRYVAEALQSAFSLSKNGFDNVIGNCNSAPPWLKTNGKHNEGGTLIAGMEAEYSEFLIAFLKGMKSRYNIDVTAISPTNEPDYQVSYESMNTTPAELSSIISDLDTRLSTESLDHVKIISPECFRVDHPNKTDVSSTRYIQKLFTYSGVEKAIDVVATHTYADPNHDSNWGALKDASNGKPVWVTESASLKTQDKSMTDAANYAKWIIRGFNEGGMTAYMMHLFYEEMDDNGDSSLVVWTANGDIILPKRYFVFKHFTNLVKKGFIRIGRQEVEADLFTTAFISPDGNQVVLQIFNESNEQDVSIYVPEGTQSVIQYTTSQSEEEEYALNNDLGFKTDHTFLNSTLKSMSINSFVFNINP
ncbi:glycosyl hydrolase [Flavobacteriaceae bacterium]|nr:glycosyl hydrolase [Flavobacteriaceae bacterium]